MINVWWHKNNGISNFGDILGPYLIEKLSGEKVCFKSITRFPFNKTIISVGSIISVATRNCKVWGSGIITNSDPIFGGKFLAVRGPLSQKRLLESGFKAPRVVGDPALLLPKVYESTTVKKYKVGIIPHHIEFDDIVNTINDSDVLIIDLTGDIEEVVDKINSCEYILSSSLHGIIVPHAYGIPAIRIKLSNKIYGDGSKYSDYFGSVGIKEYKCLEVNPNNLAFNDIDKFFLNDYYNALPDVSIIKHIQNSLLSVAPFKLRKEYYHE